MKIITRRRRLIAVFFIIINVAQFVNVPLAFALTSGPSQPEVQGFQPAGTTEMVDLFTGDFGYNIPLFELPGPNGGYPFNLSYQSGISMDMESSWVGLGWSLTPGALNRQLRGFPDEFKGDSVYTKMSVAPSVTVGVGLNTGVELFGLGLSTGISLHQNSYRGMGYGFNTSISYTRAVSSDMGVGLGLNYSVDSQDGVNIEPSLSLDGKAGTITTSAAYNSKEGLTSISASFQSNNKVDVTHKDKDGTVHYDGERIVNRYQGGATLSFSHPGYTPQINMPMRNINVATTFKIGGSWWGVFFNGSVNGFYNEQRLKYDKGRMSSPAYGYLNFQSGTQSRALLDFNREKDGMVLKESPNLAIPSLTYDIYSVTGQGISGMYRPMRNDVGIIHDQETSSVSEGGSVGVDVGIPSHVGINLAVNHSKSTSGAWKSDNAVASRVKFGDQKTNSSYEPWYFRSHGEPSSDNNTVLKAVGNDDPVRIQLDKSSGVLSAKRILEKTKPTDNSAQEIPDSLGLKVDRKSRNNVITPITNAELLKGGTEVLSLFNVTYDSAGVEKKFKRPYPLHHTAGYTALTPEGLRYNYGIPAYNLHQEEVTFSTTKDKLSSTTSRVPVRGNTKGEPKYDYPSTDKFLKKVEIPKYAHSYLLTSIVGPDYVDVTNDGLTEDDLGYWVKFTYKKTTTDSTYQWRDPYSQAHYQEGWKTDPRDDRGSYTYGEKDLWYLTKAETKSHIAIFTIENRKDGHGVKSNVQDIDSKGKAVSLLKEIKLFSRYAGSANAIKTVKFEYDYSLCQGVFNSSGGGKLTLKKVWFEYGKSLRGGLNPYVFTYHSNNPDYSLYAYDRWGNYKPFAGGDYGHNIDFPYAEQDPVKRDQINDNAASWSLKEVKLPSGGKIVIDYESDDYAYVQNQQAMQMVEIVNPTGSVNDAKFLLGDNSLKVKFKLESPVNSEAGAEEQKQEVLKYLDQKRKQLYIKLKINLRKPAENFMEYVTGYVDIDFDKTDSMKLEKGSSGEFAYGCFYVKAEKGHHPFSMRAWQHLRTNQPDLSNNDKSIEQTDDPNKRVKQIKSLGNASIITQVRQMIDGFYSFCNSRNWGKQVEAGKSWIRLNSPDKSKFGGGLRVRQVTMFDQWAHDNEGIYGQVYEYTTEEGGETISSGVAAYEPQAGADENAMRYAKKYVQSLRLHSDNNLFFEYPVNESYFPGPQVGYGKVTVTSLAAASLAGKDVKNITLPNGKKLFPQGSNASYGTTGATIHEFYTAKDFPVITDQTDKLNKPYKLNVVIPLLGSISISNLAASQGYSVITNDMHGKAKQVRNYRQSKDGKLEAEPLSWVKYNYKQDTLMYQSEKVLVPSNTFKKNIDGTLSIMTTAEMRNQNLDKYTIGQESDFFIDMRQFEDNAWGGGLYYNLDAIYLLFGVIPVPSAWPNISKSRTQLRTAVTNKVIFKSGILESTEAYDGGSRVITKNLKWNSLTGVPVLTSVNNNCDAAVYNLSIPAYTQYEGMGAAYQNIGLTFDVQHVDNLLHHDNYYEFTTPMKGDKLFPGDEFILYNNGTTIGKVVYSGDEAGNKIFYSPVTLTETDYTAKIVRSGYRNQLTVAAGNITALQDPTVSNSTVNYTKTITIPKGN
ncbi:MAG TPA: hypothetical protein VL443_01650 [Cyclobacteriaceae bacterium]|nr:hypothetical protein [Cyclobacteriaceae bacterium]